MSIRIERKRPRLTENRKVTGSMPVGATVETPGSRGFSVARATRSACICIVCPPSPTVGADANDSTSTTAARCRCSRLPPVRRVLRAAALERLSHDPGRLKSSRHRIDAGRTHNRKSPVYLGFSPSGSVTARSDPAGRRSLTHHSPSSRHGPCSVATRGVVIGGGAARAPPPTVQQPAAGNGVVSEIDTSAPSMVPVAVNPIDPLGISA